jgi:hypothetical protein
MKSLDLTPALGAILALATVPMAQGETGFLRGKGKLDLALSYSLDLYDEYALENPTQDVDDLERQLYGLYAAYGLSDRADLVVSGAYVQSEADAAAGFDDESDLQDGALQLKWRAYQRELGPGSFSFLLAPGVRAPLSDYESYADNPVNGVGDGSTVLLGRVIAHYAWRGAYAALETGYDRRNGRLDDEIPLHLTLGTALGRNVNVQAFVTNLYALGDEVSDPRLSDERDGYTRVGVSSYLRVTERFGVSLSLRSSDDGSSESTGFSLGTVFRL